MIAGKTKGGKKGRRSRRAKGLNARMPEPGPGRFLIINGDDFGLSPEVNEGILRCHREGILTSASLMVAGGAVAEGIAAARDYPGLDIGLHLVVCRGLSVLPPARLGMLVSAAGDFPEDPVRAGMRYFFNRRLRSALADECRAQVERHLELAGYLHHIDGHLNFHVHPVLLDILVDLAVEYRVPCLRLPREPVLTTLWLSRDNAGRKLVEAIIFRSLSARARRRMRERGIHSTKWLFGLHQSGNMTHSYLRGVLARLPKACVTELYFHPAAAVNGAQPPAAAMREVDLLTDPELPAILARNGIALTTYAELARGGGRLDLASSASRPA